MRYVIVWIMRLASRKAIPGEPLSLPLPEEQPDVFKCLPEYFLEDITDNFKFITGNLPQILTPQQCEEIVQVCICFLRNSEYVKNPGVKSGLVTILCYGKLSGIDAVVGVKWGMLSVANQLEIRLSTILQPSKRHTRRSLNWI